MHEQAQAEAVAFLSRPEAYGLRDAAVGRSETHGAIVFLAGERAYKLKRAVKYPYLDYSTVELRHAACAKELEVNHRMAPELYLGLAAVVREEGQLRLIEAKERSDALDWLVVMRRFEERDLLEEMRKDGRLTSELMRGLGETIADFHENAQRRPDFGGAVAMADIVKGNIEVLESQKGSALTADTIDRLARLSWAALDRLGPVLDERRAGGSIRRCHGDLHLNNICLVDGRPTLFDAIEFDERFASIDVFYDLAFLLMDLERPHAPKEHGLRAFANIVLNRYLERAGDYGGLATLPLFLSCRATIRAHVGITRAQARDTGAAQAYQEAGELLGKAIAYLEAPVAQVVAIGGASGTGKSTVARALAPFLGPCPGAVVVRSDIMRKRMAGVDETARLPPEAYTAEAAEKVFARMSDTAEEIVRAGHAVILDGVYREPHQRATIKAIAERASVPFHGIWLEAPAETLEARIAARRGDASDATVEVMRRQLEQLSRPADWYACAADRPADAIVTDLRARLDRTD